MARKTTKKKTTKKKTAKKKTTMKKKTIDAKTKTKGDTGNSLVDLKDFDPTELSDKAANKIEVPKRRGRKRLAHITKTQVQRETEKAELDVSKIAEFADDKVDLDERVQVIDRNGLEIGFVHHKDVVRIVDEDERYMPYEDPTDGKFKLVYKAQLTIEKAKVKECGNIMEFVNELRKHLKHEGIMPCDDVRLRKVGFSCSCKTVIYLDLTHIKEARALFGNVGLMELFETEELRSAIPQFLRDVFGVKCKEKEQR